MMCYELMPYSKKREAIKCECDGAWYEVGSSCTKYNVLLLIAFVFFLESPKNKALIFQAAKICLQV